MPGENYGLVLERAPFGTYPEHVKMGPGGISRNLLTLDIEKAQPPPYIPGFEPPLPDSKWYPEPWMGITKEEKEKLAAKHMQSNRHTNPLMPDYKLASGPSIMPSAPEWMFSKRVTDGLDTSDIPGATPTKLYEKPVRPYPKQIELDPHYAVLHSTGHIHARKTPAWEPQQEGPLDISDVNIGKKHGLRRRFEANPADPVYHPNRPEFAKERFDRLKRKLFPLRKRPPHVVDRLQEKVYWKTTQLPVYFSRYDPHHTDRVSYDRFRKGLREFGVEYNDADFNKLLNYVDKEHAGTVHYREFAKNCRHVDGFELPVPKRLGEEIGYPVEYTLIGQGQHVLEAVKPRGRGIVKRPNDETPYETFTGIPFDPEKQYQPSMTKDAETKYSYGEFTATLFNEDKAKLPTFTTTDMPSGYEPPKYFPPANIPMEESFTAHKEMESASIPSMPEGHVPVEVAPRDRQPPSLTSNAASATNVTTTSTKQQPVAVPIGKQPIGLQVPQQIRSQQEIPKPLPRHQSVVWNEIVSAQLAQQDDRGDMKRPSVVSIPLSGPADIPQTTTTIMKRSSVAERMLRLPRLGRESISRYQAAVWRPQPLAHSIRPSFFVAQSSNNLRTADINLVHNLRDDPPMREIPPPPPPPPAPITFAPKVGGRAPKAPKVK